VYNSSLRDGRQVAVKIINDSKGDGKDFINEVDRIIKTSHVNIVSLLGFCYENKIKEHLSMTLCPKDHWMSLSSLIDFLRVSMSISHFYVNLRLSHKFSYKWLFN